MSKKHHNRDADCLSGNHDLNQYGVCNTCSFAPLPKKHKKAAYEYDEFGPLQSETAPPSIPIVTGPHGGPVLRLPRRRYKVPQAGTEVETNMDPDGIYTARDMSNDIDEILATDESDSAKLKKIIKLAKLAKAGPIGIL